MFLLGIFFLPFSSYEGISFLGEFARESSFIFLFLGVMLYLMEGGLRFRITYPPITQTVLLLWVFIAWGFISSLLNFESIVSSNFKYTSGIVRFIRQYLVLVFFGIMVLGYLYSVFSRYPLQRIIFLIRKVLSYSFIIVCIYALFEILILVFEQKEFLPVLNSFNYFPFTEVRLDNNFKRISSVTFEPPFLAIYLITIAGWMFSYIVTEKSLLKFIPAALVLVLTYFSGSRTALVVILLQLLVLLWYLFKSNRYRKYFVYFSLALILGLTSVTVISKGDVFLKIGEKVESLDIRKSLTTSVSNKSRFGMQYANFQVFKEHPFIGVGFGQQAYYSRYHYPEWATKDNYEFELFYLNEENSSFPPGYNIYIRILAEMGVIGFIIFVLLLLQIFFEIRKLNGSPDKEYKILGLILMVSFVGYIVNWLQVDTFRVTGFWVILALLLIINSTNRKLNASDIK